MSNKTLARPHLTIMQPQGYVNASNAVGFQRELTAAVNSCEADSILLVNMSQIEYIDSAGLMALVSALSLSQRLEKRFILCCVSPAVRMIFELTQLDRVFEIFESCAACEQALGINTPQAIAA